MESTRWFTFFANVEKKTVATKLIARVLDLLE
jgi:hypothetical protein